MGVQRSSREEAEMSSKGAKCQQGRGESWLHHVVDGENTILNEGGSVSCM